MKFNMQAVQPPLSNWSIRLMPGLCIGLLLCFNACKQKNGEKKPQAKDSLSLFTSAIARDSADAAAWYARSDFYYRSKQAKESYTDLQRALGIRPDNAKYLFRLGELAFVLNRTRESRDAFLKSSKLEKSASTYFKLAELHYYVKEYKLALAFLDSSQSLQVSNPEAYFLRGMIYRENRDTTRSVEAFMRCVGLNDKHSDASMQLGLIFSAKKDPLAVTYFGRVLEINPSSKEALYARGSFFQNCDSTALAEKDFSNLLLIDSTFYPAYYNLGYMSFNQKDFRRATTFFSRAVKAKPNYADAVYMRGLAFENLGEYAKAIRDYTETIRIDRGHYLASEGLKRVQRK